MTANGTYEAVQDVAALRALYGTPVEAAIVKVANRITPLYRKYLEASPFFILATVGPEGVDCSPRGERGGTMRIEDEETIVIPD